MKTISNNFLNDTTIIEFKEKEYINESLAYMLQDWCEKKFGGDFSFLYELDNKNSGYPIDCTLADVYQLDCRLPESQYYERCECDPTNYDYYYDLSVMQGFDDIRFFKFEKLTSPNLIIYNATKNEIEVIFIYHKYEKLTFSHDNLSKTKMKKIKQKLQNYERNQPAN